MSDKKTAEAILMKNIRKAMSTDMEPTKEMIDFFETRTKGHTDRVKKFCSKIDKLFPGRFDGIVERGETHDASKYEEPEYTPYLFITWDYKCKDDGVDFDLPESVSEMMDEASHAHVTSNKHHPECHCETTKGKRGDKKGEKIDGTGMSDVDIAEMVADWASMSEEKDEPGPKGWADRNVNKKWKFDDAQTELIYELIEAIS